jgi:hypothetical protein
MYRSTEKGLFEAAKEKNVKKRLGTNSKDWITDHKL